jgi:hypothetical protein
MKDIKPDLSSMLRRWPSPYIARDKVSEFTGGIINPRTLANLDSQGLGPKIRIRVGRKIAYNVEDFCAWLESRANIVE